MCCHDFRTYSIFTNGLNANKRYASILKYFIEEKMLTTINNQLSIYPEQKIEPMEIDQQFPNAIEVEDIAMKIFSDITDIPTLRRLSLVSKRFSNYVEKNWENVVSKTIDNAPSTLKNTLYKTWKEYIKDNSTIKILLTFYYTLFQMYDYYPMEINLKDKKIYYPLELKFQHEYGAGKEGCDVEQSLRPLFGKIPGPFTVIQKKSGFVELRYYRNEPSGIVSSFCGEAFFRSEKDLKKFEDCKSKPETKNFTFEYKDLKRLSSEFVKEKQSLKERT